MGNCFPNVVLSMVKKNEMVMEQLKRSQVEEALAGAEKQLRQYRNFIMESNLDEAYFKWVAAKLGFSEEAVAKIFDRTKEKN